MLTRILTLGCSLLLVFTGTSQQPSGAQLAADFLASLSAQQRTEAQYAFESGERYNWHFIPKKDRRGIMLNELQAGQREKAFSVLSYYLSDKAYRQSKDIIQLESVLHELENRSAGDWYRDPGRYTFLFFGVPSDTARWGWRFEGHHLSFSFSSINGKLVAGTPSFIGSNPAVVMSGPQKGKEVLKSETELAFTLVQSLQAPQLELAVRKEGVPSEIVTGNSRQASLEKQEGLSFEKMTRQQQQLFLQLLGVYVQRYTKKFADDLMKEIEAAQLNQLYFLWAGNTSRKKGDGYYYRIHGPTILIEYDNTQNQANHIHTVIRDLKHDFGGDALERHYKTEH
jgi:hypothetical protein